MEIKQPKLQRISIIGRKVAFILLFLSLVLPWASNWSMGGHWFLYGYSVPLFGFRFFQAPHVMWVLPLTFIMIGWFALFGIFDENVFLRSSLGMVSAIFVLLSIHFFLEIYGDFKETLLTFTAPPSLGFYFAMLAGMITIVICMNDMIDVCTEE